jgi:hypothetical protein
MNAIEKIKRSRDLSISSDVGMHLLIGIHTQLHNGQLLIRTIIQQGRDVLEGALMLRNWPRVIKATETGLNVRVLIHRHVAVIIPEKIIVFIRGGRTSGSQRTETKGAAGTVKRPRGGREHIVKGVVRLLLVLIITRLRLRSRGPRTTTARSASYSGSG